LGKWIHQSHRHWEWYYHPQVDILVQHTGDEMWKYCLCPREENAFSTRNSHIFGRVGHWLPNDLKGFLPATVRYDGAKVDLLGSGPPLCWRQDRDPEEFWDYLHSWGGEWLWDNIYTPFGFDAVVDAKAGGSAILVTDGSYSQKIRSEIDGAGWLIYCRARKKVVFKGTTFESCAQAGSYRGELLGLLAVHLMVLAVEKFYDLAPGPQGLVACDNLGGLNKQQVQTAEKENISQGKTCGYSSLSSSSTCTTSRPPTVSTCLWPPRSQENVAADDIT
jgi:hypothetical protein